MLSLHVAQCSPVCSRCLSPPRSRRSTSPIQLPLLLLFTLLFQGTARRGLQNYVVQCRARGCLKACDPFICTKAPKGESWEGGVGAHDHSHQPKLDPGQTWLALTVGDLCSKQVQTPCSPVGVCEDRGFGVGKSLTASRSLSLWVQQELQQEWAPQPRGGGPPNLRRRSGMRAWTFSFSHRQKRGETGPQVSGSPFSLPSEMISLERARACR